MPMKNHVRTVILCALACLTGPLAHAHWVLTPEASTLSFVSIKAGDIGEVHTFKNLSGLIDNDGNATIQIDLTSVDTGIEVRDERMRNVLFNTAVTPTATFTAQVDLTQMPDIKIGSSAAMTITGTLDIAGTQAEVSGPVRAVRLAPRKVMVLTSAAILLNVSQLGLVEGVEALREIAGLPSISKAVPVTFALVFKG